MPEIKELLGKESLIAIKDYVDTVDSTKTDKVGPLPEYYINNYSDSVYTFLCDHSEVNKKAIIINIAGACFIGEFSWLDNNFPAVNARFSSLDIPEVYYIVSNVDITSSTFSIFNFMSSTYIHYSEDRNMKVTSNVGLSPSSTDIQYPSAKAVVDYVSTEGGKIDSISLNNTPLTIDANKNVNIPVSLNTGSDIESITVNNSYLSLVTKETNQSISGNKTFAGGTLQISSGNNKKVWLYGPQNISSDTYVYFPNAGGTLALVNDLDTRVNKTFLNASDFSDASTYAVGDRVVYQGKLYKCTTAISTAGAWDASKWTEVTLGNYVTTDTDQIITGGKTFENYICFRNATTSSGYLYFTDGGGSYALKNIGSNIHYTKAGVGGLNVDVAFPGASGTIALTSDINTAAANNLAPEYSSSSTYTVGQKVVHEGQLYECSTAISTAEAWNSAHWTAIKVSNGFVDLDTKQTIAGEKTFNYNKLRISNLISYTGNTLLDIPGGAGTSNVAFYGNVLPSSNNAKDLGADTYYGVKRYWRNLYLANSLTDGTNSITVANIQEKVQVQRFI